MMLCLFMPNETWRFRAALLFRNNRQYTTDVGGPRAEDRTLKVNKPAGHVGTS